jgi:integrase/recombinase XerD
LGTGHVQDSRPTSRCHDDALRHRVSALVVLMAKLDADLLTVPEIEALIRACSRRAPTGIRNRAIIALAWRSGLRCAEIIDLKPKDVNLGEGTLVVQHGKGNRRRVVGLDHGSGELIERWIEAKKKRGIRSEYLFSTLAGKRLDASYLRHALPRLAKRAGIEKRVHLHGLRHRAAVDWTRDGADLVTVQRLLGHSSAATTAIYLSRVGASEAVEFARSREWSV